MAKIEVIAVGYADVCVGNTNKFVIRNDFFRVIYAGENHCLVKRSGRWNGRYSLKNWCFLAVIKRGKYMMIEIPKLDI